MGVLKDKGVLDYFYITADFVRWAKSDLPLPERMPDGSLYFPPMGSARSRSGWAWGGVAPQAA